LTHSFFLSSHQPVFTIEIVLRYPLLGTARTYQEVPGAVLGTYFLKKFNRYLGTTTGTSPNSR
jgi:hypothetical protein